MASSRRIRWLASQLDELVEAGVLAPGDANRVRAHYGGDAGARAALPLFAVLGAVLIGLGVVLLIAHNWESLPRSARGVLGLGLLLLGQGVAGFALLRRTSSTAWCEAGAFFASLCVCASLALLWQTYQISDDLGAFVGRWAWLTLPLAYALDARAAIGLVIAIAAGRGIALAVGEESLLPFWKLVAATVPYAVWLWRRDSASPRDGIVAWLLAPALLLAVLLHAPQLPPLWLGALGFTVAAGLYALGAHGSGAGPWVPFAAPAARRVGGAAIALGVLALSHAELWGLLGSTADSAEPGRAAPVLGLGALALAAAGWRARAALSDRSWAELAMLLAPAAYALAFALGQASGAESVAAWAMAAYALALGSAFVVAGVGEAALGRVNAGMALLGLTIAMRFVDTQWSFTTRGIVFIVLGGAFLALNLWLRRRLVPRAGVSS